MDERQILCPSGLLDAGVALKVPVLDLSTICKLVLCCSASSRAGAANG